MSMMHNADTLLKTLRNSEDISNSPKVEKMFQELILATFGPGNDSWEQLILELASSETRMFSVLKRSNNDEKYIWRFCTDTDNFLDVSGDDKPGFKNAIQSGPHVITIFFGGDYYNLYPLDGFVVDTADGFYEEGGIC